MRFSDILLDFDGRVVESAPGIIQGVRYACEQAGRLDAPWEQWELYIGPSVYNFGCNIVGLGEEGGAKFMEDYGAYYREKGMYQSRVYPGMRELIEKLRAGGARVFVCTGKPEDLTLAMIGHYKLEFDGVGAMRREEKRWKKPDILKWCMDTFGIDPARAVMVGDKASDVRAGHRWGMAGVGVSYGYGTLEELQGANPDKIAGTVAELEEYLL